MVFDEHSFLFDERRNGRCHIDVRHRGLLHVLCGFGQSAAERIMRTDS